MKHIVSVSGGVGSYYTLQRVIKAEGKENVIGVFCDTLAEDGDLYRFLADIENKTGIQLVRLCVGKTPYELAYEDSYLYNSRMANCSRKLKSAPFRKWLESEYSPQDCIIYLGIDWTETHRIEAITRNYAPYTVKFPLCDPPYMSKDDMLSGLKKEGIEVPYMYRAGFTHNNCGGACFKAGIGHWRRLLEVDRRKYLEWENKEEVLRRKLGKDVSILKRNGKPYTLKQLRETADAGGLQLSFDEIYDIGGCGCFVEG